MSKEDYFKEDIAEHKLYVIKEDGEYLHLRAHNGTSNGHFEVITSPNYLFFVGDMGDYIFHTRGAVLDQIRAYNRGVDWFAEKLQTPSKIGVSTEYSSKKFTRFVTEYTFRWMRDNRDETSKEIRRRIWSSVKAEVLIDAEDEEMAMESIDEFHFKMYGLESWFEFSFRDWEEESFKDYTSHFVWATKALKWAVENLDAARKEFKNAE